jgi:hypothetical protein
MRQPRTNLGRAHGEESAEVPKRAMTPNFGPRGVSRRYHGFDRSIGQPSCHPSIGELRAMLVAPPGKYRRDLRQGGSRLGCGLGKWSIHACLVTAGEACGAGRKLGNFVK